MREARGHDLTRRGLMAGLACHALSSMARADGSELLTFEGLYQSFGVLGLEFSARVKALAGRSVSIAGYMAPPLQAESEFFVLTKDPLAICPFCQSDADWPLDILVVYLAQASPLVTAGAKVVVTGRLDTGSWTDPVTGFVSQLRLRDASYRRA